MRLRRTSILALATTVLVASQLQSCAVVAIGAAGATVAKVANDRRTVGTQLDDQTASTQVAYRWSDYEILKQANLQVDVYNRVALLTGQANTQAQIDQAVKAAQSVDYLVKIHNQIRLGSPISASTQANDIWLASKVRTQLIAEESVPALQIKVVVQNSEVFLMGKVSNQEATAAVEVARNITGVARVVRAFEIITA